MFKIIKKLDINCLQDKDLSGWLDRKFGTKYALPTKPKGKKSLSTYLSKIGELSEWGREFNNNFPREPEKALFYINRKTFYYDQGNLQGRVSFNYIWPKFFETFPLGEIWLIDISYKKWFYPMWNSGKKLADKHGIEPGKDHIFQPQEGTGFSGENFPMSALSFMVSCVFPLLSAIFCHTSSGLVFLFIPDRSFDHSILKQEGIFQKMFFDLGINNIYSDQYAFDSYGAKIEAQASLMNPKRLTAFFDWFIGKIDRRMEDIVNLKNPERIEQLTMTLNRALWDAQIAIISETPYTSKVHFFGLIDKLVNIQTLLNTFEGGETDYWKKLVSINFNKNKMRPFVRRIPGEAGRYFNFVLENAINHLEREKHTAQDLRNMRNSLHGYKIRRWKEMVKKTGILNNNIVLLSAPLIFYSISQPLRLKE